MIPEFAITKSHLQGQKAIRRCRIRKLRLSVSETVCIALEVLAAQQVALPPRSNRSSREAIEYARDALEQSVCDRFQQVFQMTVGEYIRQIEPEKVH